ncbi:RsmB/NOP family class I SAM-dependent RNA methyltransferase [Planctomycetota bacterium]
MDRALESSQSPLSARQIAVRVLFQLNPQRQFAAALLIPYMARTSERQRCTDLINGVLRWRDALDTVITQIGGRTLRSIQKQLLSVLRVAVYELTQCPSVPEHAIVHEAVEIAKQFGGQRPAGFVNAVLRSIMRELESRQAPLSETNPRCVVVQDDQQGCFFRSPLWPDPASATGDYLSRCFSLPRWLVTAWIDAYEAKQVQQICLASNRRPSVYLRPNPLHISPADFLEALVQAERQVQANETGAIRLIGGGGIDSLPGYHQGWFSVQDTTAALAVHLLCPQPRERILDLCAAPGGKTTQMAEVTDDQAVIVATDISATRLQRVKVNTERLGVHSVEILPYDQLATHAGVVGGFDAILLDVPCSNTGVLAKRVEVRYRLRTDDVELLVTQQQKLLEQAVTWLRPGGRICYSTCSIQPQENEEQVKRFCAAHPEFHCQEEQNTLPCVGSEGRDGGYAAILKHVSR